MDPRAEAVVQAAYNNAPLCRMFAAYALSFAVVQDGWSPSDALRRIKAPGDGEKFKDQLFVLRHLADACRVHGVTWADVGVGGNV